MAWRSVCRGHVAPFKAVSDAFFKKTPRQFWKRNRAGGKTNDFGLLAFLELFFDGLLGGYPIHLLDIGATENQGNKCFESCSSIWQQPEFSSYVGTYGILKQTLTLPDKSQLKVATATMKGTNSPHVPRVFLDELELWSPEILREALSISQSTKNHPAAIRIASTQKYALGLVQEWLETAPRRGYKVYQSCVFESLEKCPPERDCKSCPIYEWSDREGGPLCMGRAKFSTGYYQISDFIDKVDELDRDTLESQWLCLRPSREGLVFGRYWNEAIHLVGFDIPYSEHLPLSLTIDQGFANPWAVLFCQRDEKNKQNRLFDELYEAETLAEDMGRLTADRLEAHKVSDSRVIPVWYDPADPGAARTFIRHLKSTKGKHYKAVLRKPSGKQDLQDYLSYIRQALKIGHGGRPLTVVGAGVTKLPWEMLNYHYAERKSLLRPVSEIPVDKWNHSISCFYRWLSQFYHESKLRKAPDPRRT